MHFRPGVVPTLFVLVSVPILLALGFWQLDRTHWKDDLIARIEARLAGEPTVVTLPADLPLEEFTRVRLAGRFVPERAMWLGGRTDAGRAGWHVVAPFLLSGGGWVMVDRGWLPMAARSGAGTVADSGATSVDGVVRLPPQAGLFTPDNDPAANSWYRIDPPAMAAAAGLPAGDGVTAAYVAMSEREAGAEVPGTPLAKGDRFDLPRNHFQYALTWFGLAATLAAVYLAFGMRRRPAPDDDEREPR